ncbi:four helix bundle protein [Natroniella acetigena]|uniref:four helix bundle protein n=1 Tax=Natroniella acetigena TaxID=52004 RepID=UPI00200A9E9B|nr:four helix bundle protein [Natroniella acetigena]MCK8827314.1 four helix bundle protein [Natroniella acetigena]
MQKKNIIYDKFFQFSIEVVKLYKYLTNTQKEYVISKQLLRSGTSIAANIKESVYGQSRKDFVSKLSIALKEASETEYWLELLLATDYLKKKTGRELMSDLLEIVKMLTASLNTAKKQ